MSFTKDLNNYLVKREMLRRNEIQLLDFCKRMGKDPTKTNTHVMRDLKADLKKAADELDSYFE